MLGNKRALNSKHRKSYRAIDCWRHIRFEDTPSGWNRQIAIIHHWNNSYNCWTVHIRLQKHAQNTCRKSLSYRRKATSLLVCVVLELVKRRHTFKNRWIIGYLKKWLQIRDKYQLRVSLSNAIFFARPPPLKRPTRVCSNDWRKTATVMLKMSINH